MAPEVLTVKGDAGAGNRYATVRCPECGGIGWIDEDQHDGRISIECGGRISGEGQSSMCTYHETHDLRTKGGDGARVGS